MNSILDRNLFFIKEHVGGLFQAANNFDIYEPSTGEKLLECREEALGMFTKIFRFTKYKRYTPFHIIVRTPDGQKVLSIKRGVSFWLSKVEVFDANENLAGSFKQKLLSLGGKFAVLDPNENQLCMLKGDWSGWDFRFVHEENEFAFINKKWAGIGKELFSSADNYVLSISDQVPAGHPLRILIIAAAMSIDMVLKE